MKKKAMLGFVVGFALLLCGQVHATSLTFDPSTAFLNTDQVAGIQVWVSGLGDTDDSKLGAFDLQIAYDASVLALQAYSFFGHLGSPLATTVPMESYAYGSVLPGLLVVQQVSFLSLAELGSIQQADFPLLNMEFKAIGSGTSPVYFQTAVLSNAAGQILPAELLPATVNVGPEPIPEPATLLLVLTGGILGSGFLKRRRGCP